MIHGNQYQVRKIGNTYYRCYANGWIERLGPNGTIQGWNPDRDLEFVAKKEAQGIYSIELGSFDRKKNKGMDSAWH